jgi:3-deoxy-7-phosphoheptulonate synthase
MLKLRDNITPEDLRNVKKRIRELGMKPLLVSEHDSKIVHLVGNESITDLTPLGMLPGVEKVIQINSMYKLSAREWHSDYSGNENTKIVDVSGVKFGGNSLVIIAGPCAIYNYEQMSQTAAFAKWAGADMLRGGAFKPRTSPHNFQGLGREGLEMLANAQQETGLPTVTEVLDPRQVELVSRYVNMLQIGTRNMQNFELLKEVGRSRMSVLLKRHFDAKLEDLLAAADYILAEGNPHVVLCERGMKTPYQSKNNGRFNLDVQAIPGLKLMSYLPVIADPSHATGNNNLVIPTANAAVAAGAHGLLLDIKRESDLDIIHYQKNGRTFSADYCDYTQALLPFRLKQLVDQARRIHSEVQKDNMAVAYRF